MKGAKENVLDAIGMTPIVKLQKLTQHLDSEIYVKLEYLNPGGSIKDRIGFYMCKKAKENGQIKEGAAFIESTSGNTGVGIAMYGAIHNHPVVFTMSEKQSMEKVRTLKAFGASVIVCPDAVEPDDPRSYYSMANSLEKMLPGSLYLNQYENVYNRETHYSWTGPEIFEQTGGEFDYFITGVGTGGTISGCGKYLKEKMPRLKVIGVDVEGSILSGLYKTGTMPPYTPYVVEGIGEDFLPGNVDFSVIDDFVVVGDEESFSMTRTMLRKEAIYAGGSCGSAVLGAIRFAEDLQKKGESAKILVILPDTGARYASKIYNDDWMLEKGYDISRPSDLMTQIEKFAQKSGVKAM